MLLLYNEATLGLREPIPRSDLTLRNPALSILFLLIALVLLASCDSDAPATPDGVPSAAPRLTQGPTEVVAPTHTSTPQPTATATPLQKGNHVTALQALTQLRADALKWQRDARFVLLANVKPGQEGRLLGMALSDPDLTDPTPGGIGRNWVLLAASSAKKSVVVFDLDGTQVDLTATGGVSASLGEQLAEQGVRLSSLNPDDLADSDDIATEAGNGGDAPGLGMALTVPGLLGLEAPRSSGGIAARLPSMLYAVFAPEPEPGVQYFSGATGEPIMVVEP